MSKFCSVLELFIHKVVIFGQNGQNEVQRSSNNSRTVNAMKNLIRYSESAENSSLVFWKTCLKNMRFFAVIRHFQPYYWSYMNKMIAPRSSKRLKKTTYLLVLAKITKRPSKFSGWSKKICIGKIFWKCSKMVQSQSYHKKVIFGRLFNFFTSCRSSWLDTFGRFFQKIAGPQ